MIEKRLVPGTQKEVSVLVMGTITWSEEDMKSKESIYDRYAELDGNCLDGGYIYGGGGSARAYGNWLHDRGLAGTMMIFDKGCHHGPNGPLFTPEIMDREMKAQRERMRLDKVDFFTFHRDDPTYPLEPMVRKAGELVDQGVVDHFGGSNWQVSRIAEWNRIADAEGLPRMTHNNPNLSLATVNEPMWGDAYTAVQSDIDWHTETQFPLFSWSSLGGGWFARAESDDITRVYKNPINEGRRDRVELMAKDRGPTPTQVALAYTLSFPFPVWALVGPRSVDQMNELAEASSLRLSKEEMTWLESGG